MSSSSGRSAHVNLLMLPSLAPVGTPSAWRCARPFPLPPSTPSISTASATPSRGSRGGSGRGWRLEAGLGLVVAAGWCHRVRRRVLRRGLVAAAFGPEAVAGSCAGAAWPSPLRTARGHLAVAWRSRGAKVCRRDAAQPRWLATEEALAVLHALRNYGLDAEVDLPRICIVGKQSSGKSSVIEALTGVSLPRAAGTCTRCAYEISTRHAEEKFSCVVSVRCTGDFGDSKEKIPLATTRNPKQVPKLLRDAQRLLLNEELRERHWEGMKDGSATLQQVAREFPEEGRDGSLFSCDVVVVELRGRAFTDLELIDLPGLIQSVESDQERDLIALIEQLCNAYLEKTNTLIAMCCPFNDDMENQAIRMIARKFDPDGKRTVGVLTKADLMQKGSSTDEWLAIMRNDKFKLWHGYFAVRNPPQSELDRAITGTEARRREEGFFAEEELGRQLRSARPERCGTSALRDFLAVQLSDLIRRELPSVRAQLQAQLRKEEAALATLGEKVRNDQPRQKLLALVDQLHHELEAHVEATGEGPFPLWTAVRGCYQELNSELYRIRPQFWVGAETLDDGELTEDRTSAVELSDWDDWTALTKELDTDLTVLKDVAAGGRRIKAGARVVDSPWTEFKSFKRSFAFRNNFVYTRCDDSGELPVGMPSGWENPASWTKAPDDSPLLSGEGQLLRTFRMRPEALLDDEVEVTWPVVLEFEEPSIGGSTEDLPGIVTRIERLQGREVGLPGGPAAYRAAREIVRESQARWKTPANTCLDNVAQVLRSTVRRIIRECVQERIGSCARLEQRMEELSVELVDELLERTRERKSEVLERQEGAPDLFTQNTHYLEDGFRRAQRFIRDRLGCNLRLERLSSDEQSTLIQLVKKAGHNWEDLICPDDRDHAIWCMAAAHAYFKVAFKRFCDVLPRTIDDLMLRTFVQRFREKLLTGLQVLEAGPEQLEKWFVEDEAAAQRRRELEGNIDRQKQGLRLIEQAMKLAMDA
mmetsp:Transcript_71423/g.225682  ORF Transcript_71423/g.225682 Transcript_71423/m.225682 type:complete len:986 (+) Transcript_71423:82-3039(+)